jgi:hypothetical protein
VMATQQRSTRQHWAMAGFHDLACMRPHFPGDIACVADVLPPSCTSRTKGGFCTWTCNSSWAAREYGCLGRDHSDLLLTAVIAGHLQSRNKVRSSAAQL